MICGVHEVDEIGYENGYHIIVNDNGSLGVGRLLGLAKLGVGLGFGRTFFVLLEEGGTYSTGF